MSDVKIEHTARLGHTAIRELLGQAFGVGPDAVTLSITPESNDGPGRHTPASVSATVRSDHPLRIPVPVGVPVFTDEAMPQGSFRTDYADGSWAVRALGLSPSPTATSRPRIDDAALGEHAQGFESLENA